MKPSQWPGVVFYRQRCWLVVGGLARLVAVAHQTGWNVCLLLAYCAYTFFFPFGLFLLLLQVAFVFSPVE
jgi:hypothetical protein